MESNQREEDLTHMWGKFSLLEEENSGVSLETSEIEPLVSRGKHCLIGKLLADRVVPKEFFKAPPTSGLASLERGFLSGGW
jgi:hypothetical protein